MGGIHEPKVVIPPYDVPAGTTFSLVNREGKLTMEKQEDGTYEVVGFEAKKEQA